MALQIRINGTTTSSVVVDSSTEDPTLPVFIGRNGAALGGLKTDGSHHWNILNEGSIFGGYAVAFYGASTLTNGSATNSAAAITGTTDGVGSAPGGTVTNFGTIIALGQDGVAMGSIAVVRNIGTAAVITGYTHGVLGGGAAQLHLTNSGTIGATGSHSVGVFARADSVSADILNSGKISGSANGILLNVIGTVTNSGIITSADLAIYTTESSRLVNTGVISGGNRGFWSNFAPDVTVINSGTISGPGWRGIEIAHNVTGLVFNSGLISGNLNGVTLDAGSIINNGTIAGGTTFLGNSIANSGTMTGSGNYALVMLAAARVSNIGAGSYIHSPREGIRVDVGTGFILTNEGTISGGGLAGLALRTTDASIDNTGLISGNQYGITQYNSNTITNAGTITGGSYGIQSNGGDTIANAAGGNINGTRYGVRSYWGSLSVTNDGSITSARTGIYTNGPSRLINTGVISGTDRGFWSNYAADSTVINTGTIIGSNWRAIEINRNATGLVVNSDLISSSGNGVYLDRGRIINSGTITGSITFHGDSIANSGTITGIGNYAVVLNADATVSNIGAGSYIHSPREGIRVDVGTGFTLTNEGTISGGGLAGLALRTTDASIDNTGLISGHQYGITQYNSNTITNTGTIAGGFVGIQSRGGDTITNMAGGSIHGAHGGIVSGSGSLAVANDGMIDTDAPDPVFAAISAETLNLLNRQNGTIAQSGVAIAAGTATISNHGTILGAIEISGGGDSRLVNVAGGYIGGIPSGEVAVRSSGSGTFRLINAGTISGGDGADVVQFSNTGSTTLVEHAGAHITGVGETRISASGHDDTLRLANDGVVGVLDSMTITGFETVSLNRGAHWTAGDEIFVGTHNLNVSRGGTLAASGTWQMDDLHGIIGVVDILPTGRLQVGADAPLGGMSVGVGEAITLRGTLTTASALVVDGQVTVPDGAALTINGDLAGSGIVQIGTNSVLDLNGVSTAAQLNFIGTGATLTLTSPTRFFSAIGGLAAGDTVDLQGIRFGNGPIIASQLPGGTTDVHLEYDGGSFELTFLGSGGAYTPLGFGDDGHGGMLIYFSG